jgi:hypothetical protein
MTRFARRRHPLARIARSRASRIASVRNAAFTRGAKLFRLNRQRKSSFEFSVFSFQKKGDRLLLKTENSKL